MQLDIKEMQDRNEIQEVISLIAIKGDRGDIEGYGNLFIEDVQFENALALGDTLQGREGLKLMQELISLTLPRGSHVTAAPAISMYPDGDRDRATAVTTSVNCSPISRSKSVGPIRALN